MPDTININIPNIGKELKKLSSDAKDKKQRKACLFTLVIFAHEPKRAAQLKDLIDTILAKFPCRLIFIHADCSSKEKHFNVTVSSLTSGGAGSGGVASKSAVSCDQILIDASSDQLFRVPYVVIPYLETDLPVFLLWGQNPFEDSIVFPELQPYASRVIFDSECSNNLNLFCREMLSGVDSLDLDVMDINWALISNWRDTLRQLFSELDMKDELPRCKSIVIHYTEGNSSSSDEDGLLYPEIRALYLQAWLASCLKWRFRSVKMSDQGVVISYFGTNGPTTVTLSAVPEPNLPIGALTSIEFGIEGGATHLLQRKEKLSQVIVHTSTDTECKLPYTLPLPSNHRGMNFMKEIFYTMTGQSYKNMLESLCAIDFDLIKKRG